MSIRRFAKFSLVSIFLGLSIPFCFSSQGLVAGFQPVSAEELKMTGEPQAPGAPAVILYREVDRDDTGNTPHEFNYFRIKILKEEGRKYADVEIPFAKGLGGSIESIRARAIRPDGSIAEYDGKVFVKSIAKARGFRFMAKTFTLPDVQVGSIIEYYYTHDLQAFYVYESHWILSDEIFTKTANFSLKPYSSGNNMTNWNVMWSWQGLPPGTDPPKQGPDGIVRMNAGNIPAFQTEDYMPPEDELKARVDFIYSEGFPEKEDAQFWRSADKALNSQIESFVGKRGAMEGAVAKIVSANDTPEVKLQKIYARVQQLRNTSYEIRKTGQEEKRENEKPRMNVEEVWKSGYANGFQLTWLFLGLARAAGLEAYPVLVSDRRNYFFHTYIRDARKLNSNLVLVKLNGKDSYFDPGGAMTPYGMLPWYETGVTGLRVDKDGGTWVQTTLPEPSESRIDRKADLTLADDGSLTGNLTVTFTGLEALKRRVEERNEDSTERKKFLEDQVGEYIPAASEITLTNQPEWSSSSVNLVAEYKIKIPGWLTGAGKRAFLPVGIFSGTEKRVFDRTDRVHPIYFEFPFEKIDDVTIAMPLGWQIDSLPAAQNHDGKVILYTTTAQNDKGSLHLTRKLTVDLMLLDVKYYASLRQFFQTIRKGDEQQVVLKSMVNSASN